MKKFLLLVILFLVPAFAHANQEYINGSAVFGHWPYVTPATNAVAGVCITPLCSPDGVTGYYGSATIKADGTFSIGPINEFAGNLYLYIFKPEYVSGPVGQWGSYTVPVSSSVPACGTYIYNNQCVIDNINFPPPHQQSALGGYYILPQPLTVTAYHPMDQQWFIEPNPTLQWSNASENTYRYEYYITYDLYLRRDGAPFTLIASGLTCSSNATNCSWPYSGPWLAPNMTYCWYVRPTLTYQGVVMSQAHLPIFTFTTSWYSVDYNAPLR